MTISTMQEIHTMKQNTPQWATTLTALILGVTLSGCATSFQQNSLAAVDSFPEVSSEKSIAVDLAFSGKLNGKPWIAENTHNTAYLKNRCIEQLNDSGMFGVVSPNLGATDLTLQSRLSTRRTPIQAVNF